MAMSYLEYHLENGFIHNWLVAGPHATSVPDLDRFTGEDFKLQIARHYYEGESSLTQPPVERDSFTSDHMTLTWRYIRCDDDHFVDLTVFYHICHYLRSWAYAEVAWPATQTVACVLTTNGPADVWVNGAHVHRQEHFHHQIPQRVHFHAPFQEGYNQIVVRVEEVAMRECPYAMALQIVESTIADAPVRLPTSVEQIASRQNLERVFEAAYVERDVYARDHAIVVRWPDDLRETASVVARLQTPSGAIFAEGSGTVNASAGITLAKGVNTLDGPYQVRLMPPAEAYYLGNLRITREIPLQILRNIYSETPYGTHEQRRQEALLDATEREGSIFCEIAKIELGRWSEVKTAVIEKTIADINQRADCSDFYMVGLLGMLDRYLEDPAFPEGLKQPFEDCVLTFKYWMDEPGSDAMCYWSENHQILFHTCEVLAGQLYPDHTFSNVGQNGAWHQAKGERMALSWLRKRATGGFREWDSNCYFEEDILALAHLADLAESDQVREFATIVLDKMLFTMALNSYRGAFGSTHGRTYTPLIKGARLESTAGVGRLLWGMGVFNQHIRATVSLACAASYQLPPIIGLIGGDQPEELWSREHHAGELEQWCDCATGVWEINKVTYKTPDGMLASAQDYQPGAAGYQQHIWQATLGPDAVVFVTHPPCVSEEGSHRPNFWHGNVVLPRVAQWKDALIAVHKLPDDDWMGFTHAYFPTATFDEHALRDGWGFARRGDGYLALTASKGITLTTTGDNAYRELRSVGLDTIWLCHLGRAARDGSFEAFQRAILALEISFDELSIHCTTLGGDTLSFGWEGPLLLNGSAEPITGFKHYDSPYCVADFGATQMEIRFGDEAMRLDFE